MPSFARMEDEIAYRAKRLIATQAKTDNWARLGLKTVVIGRVFIQYSAGILSVHLRLGPVTLVEVYREGDGSPPPAIRYEDRLHMTVLEMRKYQILDDVANA